MRNAPSVLYPVGRCAFYARVLMLLAVLGLAGLVVGGWYLRGPVGSGAFPTFFGVVGLGLWLLWLGFSWWSWQRAPVGQLQWDALAAHPSLQAMAGAWRWRSEAYQEGALLLQVELVLDLQTRVLLRLRNPDKATSWVWLERGADPARWDDLRRALVAVP